MKYDVEKIRNAFQSNFVFYTTHSREEMESEEFGVISDSEIFEAVLSAEIIEEYPNDKPYPSCLLFGTTSTRRPLHIVCAIENNYEEVVVITAYHPNPEWWIDYKQRRKQ